MVFVIKLIKMTFSQHGMLYWKSFLDQAELDLSRAKNLFESGDYGFSAYSAQQSLEKHVKSYFYKLDLIDNNPQRFGHLPLTAILTDLKNEMDKIERRQQSNKFFLSMLRPAFSLYKEILGLFKDIKKSDQKILYWKYSLNLPATSQIFDDKIGKIRKLLSQFNNAFNIYDEQSFNPNVSKIQEKFSKSDAQNILEFKDLFKTMSEEAINLDMNKIIQNKKLQEKEVKLLESFNELQKGDSVIGKTIQGDMKRMMAYTKILPYLETIMKSFPHEDIGRYPTEIDKKDSTKLYVEYKDNLFVLINEISNVCNNIKAIIYESK